MLPQGLTSRVKSRAVGEALLRLASRLTFVMFFAYVLSQFQPE